MTQEQINKFSASIAEFMGWHFYGFKICEEQSKNSHQGFDYKATGHYSDTRLEFFDYNWGEFFNNEIMKCFKRKKFKDALIINCFDNNTPFEYHSDYNEFHKVWVKFRDLHSTIDMNDDIAHETI